MKCEFYIKLHIHKDKIKSEGSRLLFFNSLPLFQKLRNNHLVLLKNLLFDAEFDFTGGKCLIDFCFSKTKQLSVTSIIFII